MEIMRGELGENGVRVFDDATMSKVKNPEHRVLILINKVINISIDIDFVCFY